MTPKLSVAVIEVEPKEDTIERMGVSPDLYDAYACGCEGARQKGFRIERLGENVIVEQETEEDYFQTGIQRIFRGYPIQTFGARMILIAYDLPLPGGYHFEQDGHKWKGPTIESVAQPVAAYRQANGKVCATYS